MTTQQQQDEPALIRLLVSKQERILELEVLLGRVLDQNRELTEKMAELQGDHQTEEAVERRLAEMEGASE